LLDPIEKSLLKQRLINLPGRTAQAKAFALLLVLSAFVVRHALNILFIYTATRCLSGRAQNSYIEKQKKSLAS